MVSGTVPNPAKVRAGRLGAEKRWTPDQRTTVRIDSLTTEQRAVVLALVAAVKTKAAVPAHETTAQEVRDVAASRPPTP